MTTDIGREPISAGLPGDLYRFNLDGGVPLPDVASRFQPTGIEGALRMQVGIPRPMHGNPRRGNDPAGAVKPPTRFMSAP